MKYIYTLSALFIFITIGLGQGIEFENRAWKDALAKAKSENKLLFVDAYAQWCGPCKRMAKYEFTQEKVGDFYNKNFINLKLDMETKDGRTFDSKYTVSAYPTMFFLDGDGNIVRRVKGGRKADQLIEMAKKAIEGHNFSTDYEEKYLAGERDFNLILDYVKSLNQGNNSSLKVANEYLDSDPNITKQQRLQLVYEAAIESDSKIFEEMVEHKKEIIQIVGEDEYNNKVIDACRSTIEKSIEYKVDFLYDEALDQAKSSMTKGYKDFQVGAQMQYAAGTKDEKLYVDALKGAKKIFKDNPKKLGMILLEMKSRFPDSKAVQKEYLNIAAELYDNDQNVENLETYAWALVDEGDEKKAIKELKKGIEYFSKDGKNIDPLNKILFRIEEKI